MRNARLYEAQAGIKIAGRNINNLRYADDTTLMEESEGELKSLLMKVKENEKAGLKLNVQITKIMASHPITSGQIGGETIGIKTEFIFLVSKITGDGDCSHELKRRLLLGRKAMTNLDSILKSRDITLPIKVYLFIVSPVPQFEGIIHHSSFFMVQLSHPYMTTGKTIALTICTFVGKVVSLLFKILSSFVIAFLLRSKHLLMSWLQLLYAVILEPKKIKSVTVSLSICHEVMGPDAMIFIF